MTLIINSNFEVSSIRVIDFVGKTHFYQSEPKEAVQIDFIDLPNGIYLLIIETNNQTYSEKIIKK